MKMLPKIGIESGPGGNGTAFLVPKHLNQIRDRTRMAERRDNVALDHSIDGIEKEPSIFLKTAQEYKWSIFG